ncbi:PAS domain S-box/diguanylate cyclase (GGDEF) domain-containing protein [Salinisphaera sp. PC39]|uniref:diguanylate cyclase n=1 Tax=Salinisphaera sp. PC39 TaxID=1304156 RepID=UPI003342C4FC
MSYLRTNLAIRTAVVILLLVVVVGLGFLAMAVQVIQAEEHRQQMARLDGLLDTVQNTVSIATYLEDRELAEEVAGGLVRNPTVLAVEIRSGGHVIAERHKGGPGTPINGDTLVRELHSPFGEETVGRIALVPDDSEIQSEVTRATSYTIVFLALLLTLIGGGIVAVVMRYVTHPILRISNRLHDLRAETGEKLDLPRGSETDEIGRLVNDVNGLIDHLVAILHQERELRLEREIAERKFRTIFESAESGIFVVDEQGVLLSYNPAFGRLFGLPPSGPTEHAAPRFPVLFQGTPDAVAVAHLLERCAEGGGPRSGDFRLPGEDGATRWVHVVLNPVQGGYMQGVVNDITQRKLSEESAREQAITDTLTGLHNRLGFDRRLRELMERCRREPAHRFSLVMLDLDKFKPINDTRGHLAGDLVLKHVAGLLDARVRDSDLVARYGGDEFVILLDGTTDRAAIVDIVESLLRRINEPIRIDDGDTVQVGASFGIAFYGGDAGRRPDIVRRADEAMYRAKVGGRNTYRFHDEV